jgi:hypothetical protein
MPIIMGADRNKKTVASLIASRIKPNGQTEVVGESDGRDAADSPISEGERSAAEEMIAAFHEKDAVGLVQAFKALSEIIEGAEPESEESEEKSQPSIFG